MKKIWLLRALKIIKDNIIMKKHNTLKLTMFFLGISLAMVFHYVGPSNVMAYGAPYDGFVIDIDTGITTAWGGGAGYPPLYSTNGYQWSYSPSGYGYPNSYYGSYGGFGYGYPTYGYNEYQQPFNPYGYQQSSDPYGPGYQQPPLYDIPSFNGNEYWDPYRNTWMVYDEWNDLTYEKFIPYNGNPNPYPSPYGASGMGVVYVGYPPPTPMSSKIIRHIDFVISNSYTF